MIGPFRGERGRSVILELRAISNCSTCMGKGTIAASVPTPSGTIGVRVLCACIVSQKKDHEKP